ncbi:LOW QUALITY PROTEIN: uncharacterized protein [Panulirus ornatus]|uniref:LOW QUALITY PROTEIN: uncharacterized protein n=1 Tax=Panulirus ornatus TaxID=150431 RepID=UPI003A86E34A
MLCEALPPSAGEEVAYPALHLQSKGVPNTESMIHWKKEIPSFSNITICLHLFLYHGRSSTTPLLSYSVPEYPDELSLSIDWRKEAITVECCGGNGLMEQEGVLRYYILRSWVHMCLALDLQTRRYTLALDSHLYRGEIVTLSQEEVSIRGGGILILGQEQDVHGGGFHSEQTLEGYLADFVIYSHYLKERYLKEYVSCDLRTSLTPSVTFSSLQEDWMSSGDVEFTSFPRSRVCGEPQTIHVLFPELRTLQESLILCNNIKGKVVVPQNEEENDMVAAMTKRHGKSCTTSRGMYLWLGMEATRAHDSWFFTYLESNASITYVNFRQGHSTAKNSGRCVLMNSLFEVNQWDIRPCFFKACTVCTFSQYSILRLRGLCRDTKLDRKFIISGTRNDKPMFDGVSHTQIFWNHSTWVIRDVLYDSIRGFMEMTEFDLYPFGLRYWNIKGDMCPKSRLHLLLTACRADQYTCDDGTCIAKMQRCNLEVNCPDQSDERLCNAVVVPSDYIKEVPPARIGMDPASVHLNLTILSMQPIDTLNMKMTLVLKVVLMWRDPRLQMESLNYIESWNVIHDQETIWRPELLFQDVTGTKAETKLQWETFTAVMESSPYPDDITRVREDEVYPGEKNSLKLTQTYLIHVSCQMDLVPYPFDSQTFRVLMRLLYFTKDLVAIISQQSSVTYLGAKTLREYEMIFVEMIQSNWRNHSGLEIKFHLQNLSGFHVSSTYIPTFLMVLIAYSTFYFELDDFNDRIMVSLTSLLVLATLFTQISETTPKTSFLKLLDIWFVTCILINFTIVIMLVVINFQRVRENVTQVMPFPSKKTIFAVPAQNRSQKMNTFSRIIVPIVLFVLVMVYVGASLRKDIWRGDNLERHPPVE